MKYFLEDQEKNDIVSQSDDDGRNLRHYAFTRGVKMIFDILKVMTSLLSQLQIQEFKFSKSVESVAFSNSLCNLSKLGS